MSKQRIQQDMHTDGDIHADIYSIRMPSSARRYHGETALVPAGLQPGQVFEGANGVQYVVIPGKRPNTIPPRASSVKKTTARQVGAVPLPKQRRSKWWTIADVLLGAAAMLIVTWLSIALSNWWTSSQQDWTYTKDFRTFSVDQAVGHGGDSAEHPSHFIIQNDKGQILIIELPADNPQRSQMIVGPTLIGAGHEPVTVSFKDTTGSGRLDLLLHFRSQTVVMINNGERFIPQNS